MDPLLPLCIDLDGTLVKTDTLIESTVGVLKKKPWLIFYMPLWLLAGRAAFKHEVATRTTLNVELLPYNQELLTWAKAQKAAGRTLVLATASDISTAEKIATHLGIFSRVMASNGKTNLSSHRKAEALVKIFGEKKFSYAGNERADLPVWQHAGSAVVVNAPSWVETAASRITTIEKIIPRASLSLRTIAKTIRVHQWIKNLLLFVPLLAGHHALDSSLWLKAVCAAISFSFMSSVIYTMNDLFDLDSDRQHHYKKKRPLAAGSISPIMAILIATVLAVGSICLALLLPPTFQWALVAYIAANVAYSSFIKQIALLDVITLAALYVLRILAGGAATGIITSSWLFVFAMFFFTSLALVKRYSELANVTAQGNMKVAGRGYMSQDKNLVGMLGVASGYASLLVLALYISSDAVLKLYATPIVLWLTIPLLLFWISRIWLLAQRGDMHEDPILFAMKDVASYIVFCAAALVIIAATI